MNAAVRSWRDALVARAEKRLPALTRMRQPESLPIELHRRRIYILPTKSGIGFGVLLLVMLLGALNYQNNAALLLTCLLGATVVNSMLVAFRALHALQLTCIRAGQACAGDPLPLHLEFATLGRARDALCLDMDHTRHALSLDARGGETTFPMPTEHRGWHRVPRMRISSTLPFGLFRAWSWITPEHDVLVYPRVLAGPPPPPDEDGGAQRTRGDEDYAQLREYHFGDPLKRVAWKASARHDRLLIRELDAAAHDAPQRFEWNMLHGLDRETRISRLAGWVHEAHAAGRAWTLVLPDARSLGPDADNAHYHRCMTALALLP
ncbi:MAG TPA: DUF58 domain-containing protein [Rhodanobacteraceae bacterium]|jgi:uncharacterized protein (DUF58 family)|nr:DUF58 domain-containing protein [Rhodanobacteraceae bacterium]